MGITSSNPLKTMGKEKIKDLSKHVTVHTCSNCSTIYSEYTEELCQEIIDCFDNLLKSTVDIAKDVVRTVEQEYTEEDMINFANHVNNQTADQPGKNQLKEWGKIVSK